MGVSWANSDRRDRLPADWAQLRRACLERDGYRCQWRMPGGICGQRANQADHVDPKGPDELGNLQSLCPVHHSIKSSREGGRAMGEIRRRIAAARRRPADPHPGLRPPA
jgi:5-methylcytosine-specific restriction endonuclease McrA